MGSWFGDIRYALRQLASSPGFTAAAVTVLALGIGLNAGMFSVVYAIGFAGRAFADPDRVVQLYSSRTTEPDSYRAFSYAAYEQLAGTEAFAGVLAHVPALVGVTEGQESRRTFGVIVSRNYFDVLGVPLAAGRGFTADESRPGEDVPVVVATWAFWQRHAFDPALVGSTVRVNERPFTVVGITPRGFTGTMSVFGPELFFPLGVFHSVANVFDGGIAPRLDRPGVFQLFLVGRLAPDVSIEAATTRLQSAAAALAATMPVDYRDARLTLAPLPRFGTSTSPSDEGAVALLGALMLGLTAAVLLTVCLNLAAMLLARGRVRRKELAVRLALGASRLRVVRQLLVEGLLLSAAGGAIGAGLAGSGVGALQGAFTALLPVSLSLDGLRSPVVGAATAGFCLLAAVGFALGPALHHSRADVLTDLKAQPGTDPSPRRRWWPRHPLVAAQVALSVALLVAAGLFVRMARTGMAVDLGFDADATVLAEVDPSLAGYDATRSLAVLGAVERRLATLPGVAAVGVAPVVPLGVIHLSRDVRRAGPDLPDGARPATPDQGRAFDAPFNAVNQGYFAAMGVRLLAGRTFTDVESYDAAAPPVAILDEALARRLWPAGGALGERIQFQTREGDRTAYVVVGIVAPSHWTLFEAELPGAVFVPLARGPHSPAFLHVRGAAAMPPGADAVRQAIREAAPGLPLFTARPFPDHVDGSIEFWALNRASALFASFGVVAMVVALVGLYGVMAHAVARRTREIGIRIAVGAEPGAVRRMILGESLATTLGGVVAGVLLGLAVGQLLASVFVDVAAFDVAVFTAAPLAFVVAATAAAWGPARRATAVSPTVALRAE
ncbi:MAG: ADOP family duplicated permease [Vicinamibacterales bacterium]